VWAAHPSLLYGADIWSLYDPPKYLNTVCTP